MSIPPYIEGFPQDGSNLGNTRVQIRKNLDGTFETLAVDHINNNGVSSTVPSIMGNPGYHNVIHFQNQGNLPTTPPAVVGSTQMYTNTSNGAQQIVLESTAGNIYQQTTMLDGKFATFGPNGGNNSWTFLPGGMILIRSSTSTFTGLHTENFFASGFPEFSNAGYNIQISPYSNGIILTPVISFYINANTITSKTFQIENFGSTLGFYYTLIGFPA